MKKGLLIAALTIASSSAFASLSRTSVIGDSKTRSNDIQDVFANPAKMMTLGDQATFEFGNANLTDTVPDAQGGFVRSMGDSKWGFYLGHNNANYTSLSSNAATSMGGTFATDINSTKFENPMNLFYGSKSGDMSWGVGFGYANSEKKNATAYKKNAMSLAAGAMTDKWEVGFGMGLSSKIESGAATLTGTSNMVLDARMNVMDSSVAFFDYSTAGVKGEGGTADAEFTGTSMALGLEDAIKGEGHNFFYGVKYTTEAVQNKTSDVKSETSGLPVYAGIEADANSWLAFRAMVSQPVLVWSKKPFVAAAETDSMLEAATFGAGASFKWNKLTMDFSLDSANSGTLSTVGFGTNASLTYMF